MEAIQQARKLFTKCHFYQAFLTERDRNQIERDIQRFISIAIKEATARDLFVNEVVLYVLKSALKQRAADNSDVIPVAGAFKNLEKYLLLLIEQPWKPEFRKIKMYGGFYRTRVKSVLPDCEIIFKQAGYMVSPDNCTLIFSGLLDKTSLLMLAFDCRVGQVECETIAEHFIKVRGLSMSLGDAISNILRDESMRNRSSVKHSAGPGNGFIVNMPLASNTVLPPALPKREPTMDVPNRTRLSENVTQNDYLLEQNFKDTVIFPSRSPKQSSDLLVSFGGRPQPSSEFCVPFDGQDREIIPELPKGMCEDHMRESLRYVNQQTTPQQQQTDERIWLPEYGQDVKYLQPLYHMNYLTPLPYSTISSSITQPNSKIGSFIDEGIEPDMSTSKIYSQVTNSITQQQPVPSKQATNFPQNSIDQGYRTVNTGSIYGPATADVSISQQSHFADFIMDSGGLATYGKIPISRQNAGPPPIPSRALKPKANKDEESSRQMYKSAPPYAISQQHNNILTQTDGFVSRAPLSAPGYTVAPPTSNTESILRRERLAVVKTNSLKAGGTETPLSQQIAMARTARSMDMTLTPWKCQYCTTVNMASVIFCTTCSNRRFCPDISQPVSGDSKRPCPGCTYENSSASTHCEICATKLRDTFV